MPAPALNVQTGTRCSPSVPAARPARPGSPRNSVQSAAGAALGALGRWPAPPAAPPSTAAIAARARATAARAARVGRAVEVRCRRSTERLAGDRAASDQPGVPRLATGGAAADQPEVPGLATGGAAAGAAAAAVRAMRAMAGPGRQAEKMRESARGGIIGRVSRQSEGLLVEGQQSLFAGRPRIEAGGPLLGRLAGQLAQSGHLDARLAQAPGQAGRGAPLLDPRRQTLARR